jgi:hypothetical protein
MQQPEKLLAPSPTTAHILSSEKHADLDEESHASNDSKDLKEYPEGIRAWTVVIGV